jgi:phosphoserine phosphatase
MVARGSEGGPGPDAPPPYGTVVFDCDSTLSSIEGVDELCDITGTDRAAVEALTTQAMEGRLPLEAVYSARLQRIAPTRAALEELGRRYVATALPHARELVAALQSLGKRVFVLSGGLKQAVDALALHLGLDVGQVHAVEAFFGRSGGWSGFDELSPLTRSGGKLEVLRTIARADRGGGVALVGDGVTDLEAAPAARRFIAFGGVVARPKVLAASSVTSLSGDLAALVPLLCSVAEIQRLAEEPAHLALLQAASL